MEHFEHVFAAVGPLDAVCCCEPPGARGGSGLPWYHSLLNLLGLVKVRRAESQVFLGLAQGHLVYVAFNDEGEAVSKAHIPLANLSAGKVAAKGEWSHSVSFTLDGKPHHHVTCAYLFGAAAGTQNSPELLARLKQMEQAIVGAIASRA